MHKLVKESKCVAREPQWRHYRAKPQQETSPSLLQEWHADKSPAPNETAFESLSCLQYISLCAMKGRFADIKVFAWANTCYK
jgi:hypothetical protein